MTAARDRIHGDGRELHGADRAYCGRSSTSTTARWADVTCADCKAARRADEAAGERA